jgi:hypothetical protein
MSPEVVQKFVLAILTITLPFVLVLAVIKLSIVVAEKRKRRKIEATFDAATDLALRHPPPAGYRTGDCVAVPVNPAEAYGKVKYVIVRDYAVVDIEGQDRFWMLFCDDGHCYAHTAVLTVPGGFPDQSEEHASGSQAFLSPGR